MHLETYKALCRCYSFRKKASTSIPLKVFAFIRRPLQTATSVMMAIRFPTAKFSRSSSKSFKRKADTTQPHLPYLCLLPWPNPHVLRSHSSFPANSRRNTEWCTQHATRQPFTLRSVGSRKLLESFGTDTSATKNECIIPVYPNTSPPRTHTSSFHIH